MTEKLKVKIEDIPEGLREFYDEMEGNRLFISVNKPNIDSAKEEMNGHAENLFPALEAHFQQPVTLVTDDGSFNYSEGSAPRKTLDQRALKVALISSGMTAEKVNEMFEECTKMGNQGSPFVKFTKAKEKG